MEKEETKPVAASTEMSAHVDNEPEPRSLHFKHALGDGLYSLGKAIGGFLLDIVLSLWNILKMVGRFFATLGKNVRRFCLDIGHKWRYNDVYGRISFFAFGVSSLKHGQIANGVLYLLFEVGYIVGLALHGIPTLSKFFSPSIGFQSEAVEVCVFDPDFGEEICHIEQQTDNSIVILIFSILWMISFALFIFVWLRSINAGYNNYRIAHFVEFDKRTKTSMPHSEKIYNDMEATGLFQGASVAALKVRYFEEYDELNKKLESPMDKAWGKFILDNTIVDSRRHHRELFLLRAKKVKLDRKAEAYDAKARYKAKQDIANGRYEIIMGEYRSWMTLADEALRDGDEAKAESFRKTARKVRNKALDVQNATVNRRSRHNKKLEAIRAKSRLVQARIVDMEKSAGCFATIVDVKNYNTYGKFNVFYREKAELEKQKLFYEHFERIIAEYDRGLNSYESANEENRAARAQIEEKHKRDLEEIRVKYEGIEQRRADMEAGYDEEKRKLNAGEITKEEYLDHCKTIKGKVLSLPTKKEVRASRKEDIANAEHAYKRDYNGIKVNYNDKEYAAYCATNYMIMELDFSYEMAKKFMKVVTDGNMTADDASAKVIELQNQLDDFEAAHPEKYLGKPKTFKAQGRGMMDENLHVTLLALPVLGVIVFVLMPLVLSIIVAFTNWNYAHTPPYDVISWIGFLNFPSAFGAASSAGGMDDPVVLPAMIWMLVWTLVWAILATFTNYFLGIIYALLINKKGIKFKGLWRFIFVLSIAIPQFISLIAIGILLKDNGALSNWLMDTFGINLGFNPTIVNSEADTIPTKAIIILVNVWIGVPYTILQTSGILLNIPEDLYESSNIDGAGPATQFFKITLPYILFVTGPSLIQTFIGNINNFGVIYFLTGGGPGYVGTTVPIGHTDLFITYIYKMVTGANPRYGVASAIGIMVFIVCVFISMIMYNRSSSISQEDQFA